MANVEELAARARLPWEKWTVFLHPAQRQLVERRLRRARARLRVGRHRQDHRRAASRRAPGARESGRARAADDLLRHAGERAPHQARAPDRQRAAPGERIDVDSLDAIGAAALRGACSAGRRSPSPRWSARAGARGRRRQSAGHKFSLHFLLDRVGARSSTPGSSRLGGLPRRRAPRPEDAAAGGAAADAVVDLRARAGRPDGAEARSPMPSCSRRWRLHICGEPAAAVRLRRRGRGAGRQRRPAALPRRAGRRPAQRAVLRRRPRPAHLPAAVLVEGARRGHPRAARERCASTTAPRTRSARRPTGCSARR